MWWAVSLRMVAELLFEVFRGKLNPSDAAVIYREETGCDLLEALSRLEDYWEERAPHCSEALMVFNPTGPRISLSHREVKRCVELVPPDPGRGRGTGRDR